MEIPNDYLRVHPSVASALKTGRPIVALESALLSHGLPSPTGWETVCELKEIVSGAGAIPAVIGVVAGKVRVGLTDEEIRTLAERDDSFKINLGNLAQVVSNGKWGGTTVSATLRLACRVKIRVLATGGIGGIHRQFPNSLDISADLSALSCSPLVVACSGMKSLLDLPKTLELLETLGIPVIGYGTQELPAFYSPHSGLRLAHSTSSPETIARVARCHWELSASSAVLVTIPVPEESGMDASELENLIAQAQEEADQQRIRGPRLTPFLLDRLDHLSGGHCLQANVALLKNNAAVAAKISRSLSFAHLPSSEIF